MCPTGSVGVVVTRLAMNTLLLVLKWQVSYLKSRSSCHYDLATSAGMACVLPEMRPLNLATNVIMADFLTEEQEKLPHL